MAKLEDIFNDYKGTIKPDIKTGIREKKERLFDFCLCCKHYIEFGHCSILMNSYCSREQDDITEKIENTDYECPSFEKARDSKKDLEVDEIWKDIKRFEGSYQISNKGRFRSLDRIVKGKNGERFYKGKMLVHGWPPRATSVKLCKKGEEIYLRIDYLMADSFLEKSDKPYLRHKDGDLCNHLPENLEWSDINQDRMGQINGKTEDGQYALFVWNGE